MIQKSIFAATLIFCLGLWGASAQAVEIDISSPDENGVVHPGDEVEMTVEVTNETSKKDVVHITFELTAEVGGAPVLVGSAKRRLKLAPGETTTETIGAVVPDIPMGGDVDVTIDATAKGRRSKTEATDSLFLTVSPSP